MSSLTVYKASAGSGKTFKLTEEFLRLLFKNPANYKRILAVTFTNKATEEMKMRIINELNKIAKGRNSAYLSLFLKEFAISRSKLQIMASVILNNLLHDYSKFSVYTIDSFFQNVTRAFAKEIGLFSGYTIELDNDIILEEAVDDLLANVESNQDLKTWLTDFIKSKINEGKSWNIKNEIVSLGKQVFNEEYRVFESFLTEKIKDKSFLNDYKSNLISVKKSFEDRMSYIGKSALKIIEKHALEPYDFKYGNKGVGKYFHDISIKIKFSYNSYIKDAYEDENKWYTESSAKKQIIIAAVNDGLSVQLHQAVDLFDSEGDIYNSVDVILRNLYTLGLLNEISHHIRDISKQKNIFLLSDTAELLQSIINQDDAPFIYEKIGNHYKHFMIDEFQDTSVLQWNNFRPLILNSLSENNSNLIVGDIKQSIYRWRNSNWKLLAENINTDFENFGLDQINLDYNWRSKKNIIRYNNTVFHHSAKVLQQQINNELSEINSENAVLKTRIIDAYSTSLQMFPENIDNEGGTIQNHFISSEDENDWKFEALSKIPYMIEKIQNNGYKAKDIAFLVRKKDEGNDLADYLLKYKNSEKANPDVNYNFISDEVLFLKNSDTVQFVLSVLNFFLHPDNLINKAYILYFLNQNKSIHETIGKIAENPDYFIENLPPEFSENYEKIKKHSLYEMVEKIISIFSLDTKEKDVIYLIGFQNVVQKYVSDNTSDLHSFIEWWESTGIKQSISVSHDIDAMRIITVHKAKGLEFKVVIIPFCDWYLNHDPHINNILWCKTNKHPFDALPIIPVNYSSNLRNTIFKNDYISEKLDAYIDNLNLMYVAFTRAIDILITVSPELKVKEEIKSTGSLLKFIIGNQNISENNDFYKLNEFYNTEENFLEISTDIPQINEHVHNEDICINKYYTNSSDKPIKIKKYSKEFFSLTEKQKHNVNKGSVLHSIFERILYEKDIEFAVRHAASEGLIPDQEIDEILTVIKDSFKNPIVKEWFSETNNVLTEASILLPDNIQKRPDRVLLNNNLVKVIDYKFGEQNVSYNEQVKKYCKILGQMGYTKVRGYIWYVIDNLIVEI
ncbi:MAG: UvrD-helicase domain-containing protein [Bacteroidota bacterium]